MASSIVLDVLSSLGAGKFKFLAQKMIVDRVQRRLVEKNSAGFFFFWWGSKNWVAGRMVRKEESDFWSIQVPKWCHWDVLQNLAELEESSSLRSKYIALGKIYLCQWMSFHNRKIKGINQNREYKTMTWYQNCHHWNDCLNYVAFPVNCELVANFKKNLIFQKEIISYL